MLSGRQSRELHSSRQIQLPKVTELRVVKLDSCLGARVMAKGEALKPGSLPGFKSWLCPWLAGNVGDLLHFLVPQFHQLYNGGKQ